MWGRTQKASVEFMSVNRSGTGNDYKSYGTRPQPSLGDWMKMLLKEVWLMLAIFSIIAILGIAFAMTMQKKYTAEARLSVLVGDEYIYMSNAGANATGEGATPKQEQIVQSEIEVLTSAPVATRTVQAIGLDKLFPPKADDKSEKALNPEAKFNTGVEKLRREFGASSTPNTTVIHLYMNNKDPQMAALSLNKMIDEYLVYRRQVLFENRTPGFQEQKDEFSRQLEVVNGQISAFLKANGVSDYEAERTALQTLLANTRQELLSTTTKLYESEGRYSSTSSTYSQIPSEVRLSFETDNSKKRLELQQQLSDLLTRYTDNAQPVIEMKKRIAALDGVINSDDGRRAGVIRTGPNPVKDSLATDKARNQAEVQAMRERRDILAQQVAQLEARAMALAAVKPQYEDLLRRKAVLEDQVKQFSNREATARAQIELAQTSSDNIRIIERAVVPTKGRSMKKVALIGSVLFAAFTALLAGILRALLRNNAPAPRAVVRNLGLPVLATVAR